MSFPSGVHVSPITAQAFTFPAYSVPNRWPVDLRRREHRFFTRSTAVIALIVVIGFGFSTYVGELLIFTILTACALYRRNTPPTHKRLMLLGTLALIPAATTRPAPPGGILFLLGMIGIPEAVFILALVAHDLRTVRRVHPATMWGGALVVGIAASRVLISTTGPWLAFAEAITQ